MILKLKCPASWLSLLALVGVLCTVSIAANAPTPAATEGDISVYFSPKGGCADAIRHHIQGAQHEIRVQAYYFTSARIAKELLHAKKRGVDITVLLDRKSSKTRYSSATFFNNQGIKTFVDGKHAIAHDKIILIDDRVIITGSFNFTKAAEESNVENLIVIKDKSQLFAAYKKHFDEHLRHEYWADTPMPRDMNSTTRVLKKHLESLGYRVCVACNDPVWICSAKDDEAGQFFVAKADTEDRAIAELCELVGIDLEDR